MDDLLLCLWDYWCLVVNAPVSFQVTTVMMLLTINTVQGILWMEWYESEFPAKQRASCTTLGPVVAFFWPLWVLPAAYQIWRKYVDGTVQL